MKITKVALLLGILLLVLSLGLMAQGPPPPPGQGGGGPSGVPLDATGGMAVLFTLGMAYKWINGRRKDTASAPSNSGF